MKFSIHSDIEQKSAYNHVLFWDLWCVAAIPSIKRYAAWLLSGFKIIFLENTCGYHPPLYLWLLSGYKNTFLLRLPLPTGHLIYACSLNVKGSCNYPGCFDTCGMWVLSEAVYKSVIDRDLFYCCNICIIIINISRQIFQDLTNAFLLHCVWRGFILCNACPTILF